MEQTTPLIPRTLLFGNPDKAQVRLSPDGQYISYIAPLSGVMNVWVQKSDLSSPPVVLTHDTGRGIQGQQWAYDNQHIVFLQDANGDENWRLFRVDTHTKEIKTLTDIQNVQVRILARSYKKPQELLIGINNRDPQYHDIYKINILSGKLKKVYENKKFSGFLFDDDFTIRFGQIMNEDGSISYYIKEGNDWKLWKNFTVIDAHISDLIDIDDDNSLYWIDGENNDKGVLKKTHLPTNKTTTLFAPQKANIGGIFSHPKTNTPLAVEENYLTPEYFFLDNPITSVEEDFKVIRTLHTGDPTVISTSLDFKMWLVGFIQDNGPVQYYLYNHSTKTAKYLFSNKHALESLPLVPLYPLEIQARDGLTLTAYMALPKNAADPKRKDRPRKPMPMVLIVHGGPEARDTWGYSAMAQWLANRGYVFLTVNYRGSSGFGKSFIAAGDGEFAKKMHTDLIDAVHWAIKEKIADPQKVAIMGGSYGGYATLVGLTMTPDIFACGVDIVGMSNLETLMASIPPYWKPIMNSWHLKIGNPNTEEGRALMRERSPLHYTDHIKKPLLIAHGANDPRVKKAESDQIVAAMKNRNIPITYVLYPDEGHGFVRPQNKISFFALAEAFLGKFLGGKVEPMRDDDKNASLQIIEKGF